MTEENEIKQLANLQCPTKAVGRTFAHERAQAALALIDPSVCANPDSVDPTASLVSAQDFVAFSERYPRRFASLPDKPSQLKKYLRALALR